MAYLSDLANYLLVTPFDNKANYKEGFEKLSVDAFFTKCYAQPLFMKTQSLIEQLSIDEKQVDDDTISNVEELLEMYTKTQKKYRVFIDWIKDYSNSKVYTVSGNAGTGKTTFINNLRYNNWSNLTTKN